MLLISPNIVPFAYQSFSHENIPFPYPISVFSKRHINWSACAHTKRDPHSHSHNLTPAHPGTSTYRSTLSLTASFSQIDHAAHTFPLLAPPMTHTHTHTHTHPLWSTANRIQLNMVCRTLSIFFFLGVILVEDFQFVEYFPTNGHLWSKLCKSRRQNLRKTVIFPALANQAEYCDPNTSCHRKPC